MGHHELDAGALVGRDGHLAGGAAAVGVAADDHGETTLLDGAGTDHALVVLQEVGAEDLGGVSTGAVATRDHPVGVDAVVEGLAVVVDLPTVELLLEQTRVGSKVQHAVETGESEQTRHGTPEVLRWSQLMRCVESGPVGAANYLRFLSNNE